MPETTPPAAAESGSILGRLNPFRGGRKSRRQSRRQRLVVAGVHVPFTERRRQQSHKGGKSRRNGRNGRSRRVGRKQ